MFFAKIFRRFFFSIDEILFNFIGTLYDLLMAISRTSILTQGDIASFAARIEVLLGIFMLFKVSFSLITYVVNPDDFSDKSKGFGKLIQNSVISLILLVLVPYIFQMAFSLQTKVLEGNVLARLILGEDLQQSGVEDNFLNEAGEKMAYYVMLPFFKPNYSINLGEGSDLSECINIYERDEETDKNVFSQACKDALISVNENQGNGMDNTDVENYANGITNQSLGLTFRMNAAVSTVGTDSDEQFVIDYKSIISTVVAVIVCLLLVSFCIDIGIRSIKLAFLQLIYPIPVISFMDPKGGKDGMFSKWYKMCFSTFVSLFVRLLALYFGLYIISKVGRFGVYDVVNGSQITNGWIMIFIIIGVLMFIKQLPKILENMGIKLEGDGKFNLNPLKRLEEGAVGGKVLSRAPKAAVGAALGLGMGAVGAASGAGIGKGITGMLSGASAGLKGKKMGEIHKGQIDANQRMREARANGSTFFGRQGARLRNITGAPSRSKMQEFDTKRLEKQKEYYDAQAKTRNDIRDRVWDELENNAALNNVNERGVEWTQAYQAYHTSKANVDTAQQEANSIIDQEKKMSRRARNRGDVALADQIMEDARNRANTLITDANTEFNNTKQQVYETLVDSGAAQRDASIAGFVREFNIRNEQNVDLAQQAGITDINLENAGNNHGAMNANRNSALDQSAGLSDQIYRNKSGRGSQVDAANYSAINR